MFRIMILQTLYNLSDDAVQYQITDRLSFMRFLGFSLDSTIPDAKTIWAFRNALKEHNLASRLFRLFNDYLNRNGFEAKGGQIIDASIVRTRIQRNPREENAQIKSGKSSEIEGWSNAKRAQKDVDARWTRKGDQNFFGYKNHIQVL